MRQKYLPSFVKRRGRITKSQENNLNHLEKFEVSNIDDISKAKISFSKLTLEIGFGNGDNTLALAKANPGTLYLASEVYIAGIGYLLGEIIKNDIQNIKLISGDIRLFIEQIKKPIFDDVLIICPDPWPKLKHHKRRMINSKFLKLPEQNLIKKKFFTDNKEKLSDYRFQVITTIRLKIILISYKKGF